MRVGCLLGCAVLLLTPTCASAQESTASPPGTTRTETDATSRDPARLYVGMWTVHLKQHVVALDNNWLVGFAYRRLFGATFLNSFGRRSYAAGYQRTAVSTTRGPVTASLGFRLGAVSGYDGRFMRIARNTPVLPLISGFGNVDVGRVGFEVSYTMVVVSVAVSYRLGR